MHQLLKIDQTVRAETSKTFCRVARFLGGGGQGEVYAADWDGSAVALKWYFPQSATQEQRLLLEDLIHRTAPDARFLWPIELVSSDDVRGFGYVMRLRPQRFKGIVALMKRRVDVSFRTLATACFELADSYYQLHANGLCYRDISFGNVFFDPGTGEVLICDNDNVAVNRQAGGGVLGTPKFMAPEIVRGESAPSRDTDLYSLAALLFYMLIVHHPLEGRRESAIKCFDLPAMTRIYGTDPLFIFDPDDESNRPDPAFHGNALAFWPIYPELIRELFTRSFTEGLRNPLGRVRETEWRSAMIQTRDRIMYCTECGAENFFDQASNSAPSCWACRKPIRLPYRLQIGAKTVVMLNHDTELYHHHLDESRRYDFVRPTAQVVQHPQDKRVWGLKNLTDVKWTSSTADGAVSAVEPGRSVRLARGTRINFGTSQAEILAAND